VPAQGLQESIDQVLALLPEPPGEMTHIAWRSAVLSSGTPNGEEAMRRILKVKLASFRITRKDGDTEDLLYVGRLS